MKHLINRLVVGVGVVLVSGGVVAATQGTQGTTSTGTVTVSVSNGNRIIINTLSDLAFGAWSGSGDMTLSKNPCVGRNGNVANGYNYGITATSTNGSGTAFRMKGDISTTFLSYSVEWGGDSLVSLSNATQKSMTVSAGKGQNINCSTPNSTLKVTISAADLEAAAADEYTDTLTLTVVPE